jgi:hypothetical protein
LNSLPPPIPSPAKRKNAAAKAWLLILAILGVALIAFAGWHWRLASKIGKRLAAVRAAHEPVTLAELNRYYPEVPALSNAAVAYGQAFRLVLKCNSTNLLEHLAELPAGPGPLPHDLMQQMEQAVSENSATLDKLEIAASLPACRYPVDYTPGWNALLPHLNHLPKCSSLQLCRGVLREQRGDVSGAIDSIALILQHAASLDSEPDLISVLIQQKLFAHASELLRWILSHRQLSQPELERLQHIFARAEQTGRLEQAMTGERCFVLAVFDYKAGDILAVIDPEHDNRLAIFGIYVLRVTGKLKEDEIRFLDRMTECREVLRLPLPERLDRAEEIREEISREAVPKKFILTGVLVPGLFKGFNKDAQDLARRRLANTALATEQFRLNRGRLPASLTELIPNYLAQVPDDPFSGEALNYTNRASGYVLYSVGPDRQDDGGLKPMSRSPLKEVPSGDIIFAVGR